MLSVVCSLTGAMDASNLLDSSFVRCDSCIQGGVCTFVKYRFYSDASWSLRSRLTCQLGNKR
jgi:hypothetical protein